MKKLSLLLISFAFVGITKAQLKFLSYDTFGQIQYAQFDPQNDQLIYAKSTRNHIVQSPNGGITWEIAIQRSQPYD